MTETLPLKDVSFDVYLSPRDTGRALPSYWPPPRFTDRDARIDLLRAFWQGDLTDLTDETSAVRLPVNYFRRVTMATNEILMGSEPEAALPIADQAGRGLTDMMRYGGGILWAGRNAERQPFVSTVNPPAWYPRSDGGAVFVMPYLSDEAPTSYADRAEIVTIEGETGVTTVDDRSWAHGMVGQPEGRQKDGGTSRVFLVPREPLVGRMWGTSLYLDLAPPILEIAKRFTANSQILKDAGAPVLVWYMNDGDARNRFPSAKDDPTDSDRQEAIDTGLEKLRESPVIQMPPEAVRAEYLEFTGSLDASFEQLKVAKDMLNFLSGIPSLLERREMPMSGVALKLTYLPFYRMTQAMQNAMRVQLEAALTYALGSPQTVVWPHVFDVDEALPEASVPAPNRAGSDGNDATE